MFNKPYHKKLFNTFFPKWLLRFDPYMLYQRSHWRAQEVGGQHGCDKYEQLCEKHDVLFAELKARISLKDSVLDLGCNCGAVLNALQMQGYSNLAGVEICAAAVEYGKKKFGLTGVDVTVGSYEDVLPRFVAAHRSFDVLYSGGASISLVHTSFDIIKYICLVARKYVILLDEDSSGFAYPRVWEYEFNRHGFTLVKFVRPSDGRTMPMHEMFPVSSLGVFQKVE